MRWYAAAVEAANGIEEIEHVSNGNEETEHVSYQNIVHLISGDEGNEGGAKEEDELDSDDNQARYITGSIDRR